MTTRVCPYLRAVDDPSIYYSTPDGTNVCYAVPSDEPAQIPLDFQGSTCLAGQFGLCSRYRTAERLQTRWHGRRLFAAGGGLVALAVLAVCACLTVLALMLGPSRLGLVARMTETPQPTATPTLTWTPTTSSTPTEQATYTATATTQPFTPTATVAPVSSPSGEFVSPLGAPTLAPTATQPQPIATQPRLIATRRIFPTATRRAVPVYTRAPTLTPRATSTRAPTSTPLVACRTGDTMTFIPASPAIGETFVIEVRSYTAYTDVSLTGSSYPGLSDVDHIGYYYVWQWEESFNKAGTYTYSFKIKNGAATCVTKSVTVSAPTDTPTPTPTVTPAYDVGLAFTGDDFRAIFTDTQPVIFELELTNGGNITDSFRVGLDAGPPQGWTAQYCIGDSCSDHTVPDTQVTLPEGGSQALSIKLIAASDAEGGYALSVTLWVESVGDPAKRKSQSVTVVVTKPSSSP